MKLRDVWIKLIAKLAVMIEDFWNRVTSPKWKWKSIKIAIAVHALLQLQLILTHCRQQKAMNLCKALHSLLVSCLSCCEKIIVTSYVDIILIKQQSEHVMFIDIPNKSVIILQSLSELIPAEHLLGDIPVVTMRNSRQHFTLMLQLTCAFNTCSGAKIVCRCPMRWQNFHSFYHQLFACGAFLWNNRADRASLNRISFPSCSLQSQNERFSSVTHMILSYKNISFANSVKKILDF